MFCPKCGSENEASSGFCGSCGASLKKDAAAAGAAKSSAISGGAAGAAVVPSEAMQESVKKSGKIIGIIVAIAVVAVVAAAVITGGFGLFGLPVKENTDKYTWDELTKISAEIAKASNEEAAVAIAKKHNLTNANGLLDGNQTKNVQLSNGQNVQVQIAGFAHDEKSGGGKAGITFIFKDGIAERPMNSSDSNAGGWEKSAMRAWLASDGIGMLPSDLQSKIAEVKKMTNNVGETKSTSSVTPTNDKLWLYSWHELAGNINISGLSDASTYNEIFNAEGNEYKLFRDQSVKWDSGNGILTKWYNGVSCYWWERSAFPYGSYNFNVVGSDGHPNGGNRASNPDAVVPGFCI